MKYLEVQFNEIPLDLLLKADPSEQNIRSYSDKSWCFVAKNCDKIIGVCIAKKIGDEIAEIFNVAVYPECQKKGVGSSLLTFALDELSGKQINRVELGTGTFGYQLIFYQRLGFRVDCVLKEHFTKTYQEPIFEHGIQHKDMLRLYIKI